MDAPPQHLTDPTAAQVAADRSALARLEDAGPATTAEPARAGLVPPRSMRPAPVAPEGRGREPGPHG